MFEKIIILSSVQGTNSTSLKKTCSGDKSCSGLKEERKRGYLSTIPRVTPAMPAATTAFSIPSWGGSCQLWWQTTEITAEIPMHSQKNSACLISANRSTTTRRALTPEECEIQLQHFFLTSNCFHQNSPCHLLTNSVFWFIFYPNALAAEVSKHICVSDRPQTSDELNVLSGLPTRRVQLA